MMQLRTWTVLVAGVSLMSGLSGCGLLYRQPIAQGNVFDQAMVDQLKPGMSKRQVELVMGSAATQSPFHQSRWEYVTSMKDATRDPPFEVTNLTLHFEGDRLVRIEGDLKPGGSSTVTSKPEAAFAPAAEAAEATDDEADAAER